MNPKKGDIVMLKSGSPPMTVENVVRLGPKEIVVTCAWFVDTQLMHANFDREVLQLAPEQVGAAVAVRRRR